MPEEFHLFFYDNYYDYSRSSSDRLRTLRGLFENVPWVISQWPDDSTGPNFNMKVQFVGPVSIGTTESPSISYIVRVLSEQATSDSICAAVRMALSAISPYVRDGTISDLSFTLPDNQTLRFESQPLPSVIVNYDYRVPIDAGAPYIAKLEHLQDLEYSFDLRIKFASVDGKIRYVGDSSEEYDSFLTGLPQGWQKDLDDFHIQTRLEGTRKAWYLRNDELDVAVVEHETGVEFLLGVASGLATAGLYDLIKWGLKKWQDKRRSKVTKSTTFLEIERTQKDFDGNLLGSEIVRIRGPMDDSLLRSTIERMIRVIPSDTDTTNKDRS